MYCGDAGALDLLSVGVGEGVGVEAAVVEGFGVGFASIAPICFQRSFFPDFIHLNSNPFEDAVEFIFLQLAPVFIVDAALTTFKLIENAKVIDKKIGRKYFLIFMVSDPLA